MTRDFEVVLVVPVEPETNNAAGTAADPPEISGLVRDLAGRLDVLQGVEEGGGGPAMGFRGWVARPGS